MQACNAKAEKENAIGNLRQARTRLHRNVIKGILGLVMNKPHSSEFKLNCEHHTIEVHMHFKVHNNVICNLFVFLICFIHHFGLF